MPIIRDWRARKTVSTSPLEDMIEEVRNVKLIIVDPITSYLQGIDGNKSADIRATLDPLKRLAERTGAAVLLINHLSKGSGPAITRSLGSISIVSMARTSWAFAADQDDQDRRLILPTKSNIGPDTTGMAYQIVAGQVVWEAGPVTISADEALEHKPGGGRGGEAVKAASDWLRDRLNGGAVESNTLFEDGLKNGHAKKTLYRAKELLAVRASRDGGRTGKWFWTLPVELGQFDNLTISTDDWPTLNEPRKNTDEINLGQFPGDKDKFELGQDKSVPPNSYREVL